MSIIEIACKSFFSQRQTRNRVCVDEPENQLHRLCTNMLSKLLKSFPLVQSSRKPSPFMVSQ